jgi:hypothetical protein
MAKKEEKKGKDKKRVEKTREEGKKNNKELEMRIEEEQQKLQKKKKQVKQPESKKPKKEKELSDKVKAKKPKKGKEESLQKEIDYHRFLEMQLRKLDYAALFGYLGNLKLNKYEYSDAMDERVKVAYKKDETLPWERVKFYIDEHKMNNILNQKRDFENNDERHAYKWWAAFNRGMSQLLFDLSYT